MALRVGMIGTYDHVSVFAPDAARRDDVEFVGAYEPDAARIAPLVKEHGLKLFGTKEELLDQDLDAVGLFSPFYEKAGDIATCLDRGIHVLSDKPAAINPEGLARIREAVRRNPDVRLTMALTQRFGPAYNKIHQLIQEGAIGEVVSLATRNSYKLRRPTRPEFMFDDRLSGGEWVELAVHGVHTVRWLAGREFRAVTAFHGCASSPNEPFQDHGEGLFELEGGVTAFVAHDRLVPEAGANSHNSLQVLGSHGRIDMVAGSGLTLWNDSTEPTVISDLPGWLPLFGNFVDSIRAGVELTVPSGEVIRTTEAVLAAYASARAGGRRVEF